MDKSLIAKLKRKTINAARDRANLALEESCKVEGSSEGLAVYTAWVKAYTSWTEVSVLAEQLKADDGTA